MQIEQINDPDVLVQKVFMGNTAVYGAGNYANVILRFLISKDSSLSTVKVVIVSKREQNDCYIEGVPIIDVRESGKYEFQSILIAVSENKQGKIIESIKANINKAIILYVVRDDLIERLSENKFFINDSNLSIEKYPIALERWYRAMTKKEINLDDPKGFNEKIQWIKLYGYQPIMTELTDKIRVREWVRKKIGDRYLISLLGIWNDYKSIDFTKLPNQFVLKCNHGSAMNEIVLDKDSINHIEQQVRFEKWLSTNFAFRGGLQLHYKDIRPMILAEEYLSDEEGMVPTDYKFMCFDGQIKLIEVDTDRYVGHKRNIFDYDWKEMDMIIQYPPNKKRKIEPPSCIDEMKDLVKVLAEGFRFVRVDMYEYKGRPYFGEMTFTHGNGVEKIIPEKYDEIMGSWIKL